MTHSQPHPRGVRHQHRKNAELRVFCEWVAEGWASVAFLIEAGQRLRLCVRLSAKHVCWRWGRHARICVCLCTSVRMCVRAHMNTFRLLIPRDAHATQNSPAQREVYHQEEGKAWRIHPLSSPTVWDASKMVEVFSAALPTEGFLRGRDGTPQALSDASPWLCLMRRA